MKELQKRKHEDGGFDSRLTAPSHTLERLSRDRELVGRRSHEQSVVIGTSPIMGGVVNALREK